MSERGGVVLSNDDGCKISSYPVEGPELLRDKWLDDFSRGKRSLLLIKLLPLSKRGPGERMVE